MEKICQAVALNEDNNKDNQILSMMCVYFYIDQLS